MRHSRFGALFERQSYKILRDSLAASGAALRPADKLQTHQQALVREVQACARCARMQCSRRVLTERNGPWDAKVMFVAEAPGRLGAEVTGVPLFGDRTGDRFEELLRAMRWNRRDVFITNAVLCNPRNEAGNNDVPTRAEILNCSEFLRRTIAAVEPVLVVALGRIALDALKLIHQHNLSLQKSAGAIEPWAGRNLGVLYHPGPRTVVHRRWQDQIADACKIAQNSVALLEGDGGARFSARTAQEATPAI